MDKIRSLLDLLKGGSQAGGSPKKNRGFNPDEKVKFISDLLNKEEYTTGELMNLKANTPKDAKFVGWDDIFNLDDPKVRANQELAETLQIGVESDYDRYSDNIGRNEINYHDRQTSPYSVVGNYSYGNENQGGVQRLLGGIPMMNPITVTPEGATTDYSTHHFRNLNEGQRFNEVRPLGAEI